jgi:predicted SAM-dependent methyltransferase
MRVHLGCGAKRLEGWVHVDAQAYPHVDHQTTIDKLDVLPDASVDELYACHVLEHVGRRELLGVLREWNRVLKAGATVRISVPDFDAVVDQYKATGQLHEVMGLLVGGQRDRWDYHCVAFNLALLTELLECCGFAQVQRYDWRAFLPPDVDDYSRCYLPHLDTSGRLMSLNVTAVKTAQPKPLDQLSAALRSATKTL